MPRFILTKPAADDVRQILDYIRERSPQGAQKVRMELRRAMELLASFPGFGHLREDVTDEPIRFWCVYSYSIAYRPDTKPLQIIRVIHGARDLPRLFGKGE